jgi:hypothetical protein
MTAITTYARSAWSWRQVFRTPSPAPGVVVEGTLLLDDENGDDPFDGWADYMLFVELGRRLLNGGEAPEPEPVTEAGPEQKG